jgi:Protein of unknown function (DUF3631)
VLDDRAADSWEPLLALAAAAGGDWPAARPYGSGRVFLRGRRWWIAWCIDGKEVREPGGETQREAARKLRDRVRQGDDYAPGQDRVTVRKLVDEYLVPRRGLRSLDKLRSHSVALLALLGNRRAARVTSGDLAAYEAAREAAGKARATVNRELELLRAAYRLGVGSKPRAGVSETVVMGISGHRTRATFDRYNITSVEDTREALEAVSAWTQRKAGA